MITRLHELHQNLCLFVHSSFFPKQTQKLSGPEAGGLLLFPGCDAPRKRPRRGAHSGAGRMRFIRCRGSGGCRQSSSAGRRRRGCSRSSCRRGTVGSSKRNSTRKLTFLGAVSWWARVDYASRAAKNIPQGCFCAVFGDSAAAVLIHPLCPPENCAKQKVQRTFIR